MKRATPSVPGFLANASLAVRLLLALTFLLLLIACGSDSKPPAPQVSLVISPTAQAMWVNATQQFTATVTGGTNTAVQWAVTEANGGTVDSTGKYTAPATSGTYHVVATSQADTTKSASAAVIVSVPAPTFSSAPVVAAAQDSQYSYQINATDPAGTAITLKLTTAPDGATLSGNTVTWTPTSQQARQKNAFTVTATTAAGGSATQSWAVAPTGTIRGSIQISHWSADGKVDIEANSVEAPFWTFAALVPQANGSLTVLPGTGYADATFEVPGVPEGYYWLQFQPGDVVWTNANVMDYGSDAMGRKQKSVIPQFFGCNVTGLDPWNPGLHTLDFYSINAQAFAVPLNQPWYGLPLFGDTTCQATNTLFPMGLNIISGDISTAAQFEQLPGALTFFNAEAMGPALNQFVTMDTPMATTVISGELTRQAVKSQDFNVGFAAWKAAFDKGGPTAPVPQGFQVFVESRQKAPRLNRTDPMLYGFYPILAAAQADASSAWPQDVNGNNVWPQDGDFGTVEYNDPFGDTNATIYTARATARYAIPFPNSTQPVYATVAWYLQSPTMANPFVPLVEPIGNAKIDGKALLTQSTVASVSPTLTWTAPPTQGSLFYTIDICEPYQNPDESTGCNFVYEFSYYPLTTFKVPAGMLTPGHNYIFVITSTMRAAHNPLHPNRYSLPEATAFFISAAVTVDSAATPGVVNGDASILALKPSAEFMQQRRMPMFTNSKFERQTEHSNSNLFWVPGQTGEQTAKPGKPYTK